jgi:hypothetical protein
VTPSSSSRDPLQKRSDLYGECANPHDSSLLDEKKVQDHIKKLLTANAEGGRGNGESTESGGGGSQVKKRGYNSMTTAEVTREEMEAYRRIKVQREDPMAKYLSSEELLEE